MSTDSQRLSLAPRRRCQGDNQHGEPCRQAPLLEGDFCFWHDPEHAEEAAQARRLGGQRRRREKVVESIYDLGDLDTVADLRRILRVATLDTVALDNGVQRNRTLATLVLAAARLLEVGELEERLQRIESTLEARPQPLKAIGR